MIKIRRIGAEPATCISYSCDGDCSMSRALTAIAREEKPDAAEIECPQKGGHLEYWRPDPAKTEFSVSAIVAHAAVASGFFQEVREMQAKLKSQTIADPATETKSGN